MFENYKIILREHNKSGRPEPEYLFDKLYLIIVPLILILRLYIGVNLSNTCENCRDDSATDQIINMLWAAFFIDVVIALISTLPSRCGICAVGLGSELGPGPIISWFLAIYLIMRFLACIYVTYHRCNTCVFGWIVDYPIILLVSVAIRYFSIMSYYASI